MKHSLLLSYISVILIFSNMKVFCDTLSIHYVLWAPTKYSLNNGDKKKVIADFAFGLYRPDFKRIFNEGKESYTLMKKSEYKRFLNNSVFAIPAGVMLGIGLANTSFHGNFLTPAGNRICWGGGIAMFAADILIGISSFKDLKLAVQKWNDSQ